MRFRLKPFIQFENKSNQMKKKTNKQKQKQNQNKNKKTNKLTKLKKNHVFLLVQIHFK